MAFAFLKAGIRFGLPTIPDSAGCRPDRVAAQAHLHIYNDGTPGGVTPGPGSSVEAPPSAAGRSYWDHNRSVMSLAANGARRRFYYHRPRPGMAEAGARSGSLLFDGVRAGNTYAGIAYVFDGACGAFDDKVDGHVVAESRVVMRGLAPRVDPRTCSVFDDRPDALAFDLL